MISLWDFRRPASLFESAGFNDPASRLGAASRVATWHVERCAERRCVSGGEVISRIRDLIKKAPPRKDSFDINTAILEVIGPHS
jgi:hypothetical protein